MSFGQTISEYDFPVFNERTVRAAAGLLFVFGFTGWLSAIFTNDYQLLRAFGAFFMIDMFLRLFTSKSVSPSMLLGSFLVRKQRPEWVDAKPKQTAWGIGLGLVLVSCLTMGWFGLTGPFPLALCGICLTFLFAEAALGFCAGCWLHMRFSKTPPQLCSGDVCNFDRKLG